MQFMFHFLSQFNCRAVPCKVSEANFDEEVRRLQALQSGDDPEMQSKRQRQVNQKGTPQTLITSAFLAIIGKRTIVH